MPALRGDYFQDSVILLIEHNRQGAFGLMINKPAKIELRDLLPQLQASHCSMAVLEGGPVEQNRIFFLHSPDQEYGTSLAINPEVMLSTSPELLTTLSRGEPPEKIVAIMGYTGWGEGQLEAEIVADSWLVAPFDMGILFSDNHQQKAADAAKMMGVDLNLIGPTAGHG